MLEGRDLFERIEYELIVSAPDDREALAQLDTLDQWLHVRRMELTAISTSGLPTEVFRGH